MNCWRDYTRNAILERLSRDLVGTAVPRSASTSTLLDRVHRDFNGSGVVILNEVDQLRETELLYDLHEFRGLSWIGIANDEIDLVTDLDERVRSRISVGYQVRFDRYGGDTIAEMLERRAREGLGPNGESDEVFETIARLADGDARMGVTTLPVAARKASSEGLSNIPRRLVDDSISEAEREIARKTYSKLNDHQWVVVDVLQQDGPLIQREPHERYSERHDDPVSLRYFRDAHLTNLEHYGLISTRRKSGKKLYSLAQKREQVVSR